MLSLILHSGAKVVLSGTRYKFEKVKQARELEYLGGSWEISDAEDFQCTATPVTFALAKERINRRNVSFSETITQSRMEIISLNCHFFSPHFPKWGRWTFFVLQLIFNAEWWMEMMQRWWRWKFCFSDPSSQSETEQWSNNDGDESLAIPLVTWE